MYELKPERVRLDATTVSGYHASGEDTLFQYGHSKDDPSLAQVKVMVASLDPLGLPLITQVVAGNTADDPLYVPAVDRVLQIIEGVGFLFVRDCKMSALSIRALIHQCGQHYLCPLAQTGKTGQEMIKWIEAANDRQHKMETVYVENDQGEHRLLAEGYEFERLVWRPTVPKSGFSLITPRPLVRIQPLLLFSRRPEMGVFGVNMRFAPLFCCFYPMRGPVNLFHGHSALLLFETLKE